MKSPPPLMLSLKIPWKSGLKGGGRSPVKGRGGKYKPRGQTPPPPYVYSGELRWKTKQKTNERRGKHRARDKGRKRRRCRAEPEEDGGRIGPSWEAGQLRGGLAGASVRLHHQLPREEGTEWTPTHYDNPGPDGVSQGTGAELTRPDRCLWTARLYR